jgi:hypothetical protein
MSIKRKRAVKKKGGRPSTGAALPMRQLRMSKEQVDAVADWATHQPDRPNWSEAVRRLVALALGNPVTSDRVGAQR